MSNSLCRQSYKRFVPAGLLIIVVMLVFLPSLIAVGTRLFLKPSLDYNEGWNVQHTLRFLRGEPLYVSIERLPITPVNYPPLSFLITAALVKITQLPVLQTGRLLSFFSFVMAGLIIARIVYLFNRNGYWAVVSLLVWMAIILFVAETYVGMFDPQFLAHVCSLAAFYLFLQQAEQTKKAGLAVVAALLAVSLGIKHLLIVLPVVIVMYLVIFNRRRARQFFLSIVLACGIVLGLSYAYGGTALMSNFLDLGTRAVSWQRLEQHIVRYFFSNMLWVLFLPGLIGFFVADRRMAAVLLYAVGSCLLGMYVSRGAGVDVNAWFDFFAACSIVVGVCGERFCSLVASKALTGRRFFDFPAAQCYLSGVMAILLCLVSGIAYVRRYTWVYEAGGKKLLVLLIPLAVILVWVVRVLRTAAGNTPNQMLTREPAIGVRELPKCLTVTTGICFLVLLLLPVTLFIKQTVPLSDRIARFKQDDAVYRKAIAVLQSISGDALYEDLLLGVYAEKRFLFDPFCGSQMMAAGIVSERELLDRIEAKGFGAIVLLLDLTAIVERGTLSLETWDEFPRCSISERWTDNVLRLIYRNYRQIDSAPFGRQYIYVRR